MSQGLEDLQPRSAPPKPVAVIDIGTTSIRMAIAEIDEQRGVRVLETLQQAVNLGKDTFTTGRIGKTTIENCVQVLRSYRQMLTEYQIVSSDQIRIIATSAVREAVNRLAFLDRIYIATGLQIEPIDEAEETRITYLGILPYLRSEPALQTGNTIVVEVGGGSTELLVVHDRNVLYANSYRLGSLRLRETLEAYNAPEGRVREFMESQIERTVDQILEHVTPDDSNDMIALGGDMRFATYQLVPDWNPKTLARVPLAALEKFTDRILAMSEDQLVRKYTLSYPDADTVGPALLTYVQLARAFKQHASQVAETTRQLFDQLRPQHQLDHRFAVILYIAALLHEIGLYVGFASHHKHTMYLLRNSELFGLGRKEVLLAAIVARYYRRASPQPSHEGYATLDRDERVAVSKLAAMLRIAVALNDSRSQRINNIRCEITGNRLVIPVLNVQ
ncbi:MAG: exopolyphosphatase, partial [Planctomycetia bacterium]|nr:exopolyphosphatase [Planctomycetia bacterium]